MTHFPTDWLEAERFYRSLQAYCISARNGNVDPWGAIPWTVNDRHAEIIKKLVVHDPGHRQEVTDYLNECLRLVAAKDAANVIPFRKPQTEHDRTLPNLIPNRA